MINKRFAAPALLALATLLSAGVGKSFAAPIMFATFTDPSAIQSFNYLNETGAGAIIVTGAPIDFEFTAASGLSTIDRPATLTITTPTFFSSTLPFTLPGSLIDQPVNNVTTLSIIENGTGRNLLTMNFTGDIVGQLGGPNASLSGADSTGQTVTFTSDFLTFTPSGNSYNLGLANATSLIPGPLGYLFTMQATIDGMFTANAPQTTGVGLPEPGTLAFLAAGLTALVKKPRRKA